MMKFGRLGIAGSGLAACLSSRAISRMFFPELLPVMQSIRWLSGVPVPWVEEEVGRMLLGPLDPASPDADASVQSKLFGGYLYTAKQYDFYRPLEWKKNMSIGEVCNWCFSRNSPYLLRAGELPRRETVGAHTFFAIIGFDELTLELYQLLMQRIKLPEAAVFAVKDNKEADYVGRLLSSGRVWPSHGFTVLPVYSLGYWPEGDPPASHQVEFPTLAVPGPWIYPQICVHAGWYNKVEQKKNFRGIMYIPHVGYSFYRDATFWRGFAAGSLKKGSQWYKRMKIASGVKAGKVVVLESRQQVLEEAEKAAEFFQVAMALQERDDILRERGYPDLPDEISSLNGWKRYQRGGGLNPLIFGRLSFLLECKSGLAAKS